MKFTGKKRWSAWKVWVVSVVVLGPILAVSQQVVQNPFRIVNGKIHNVAQSKLWETLPVANDQLASMSVSAIHSDVVIFEKSTVTARGDTLRLGRVAVTNWPVVKTVTTGTIITSMRAIRIGRFEYFGEYLPLYDYGIPTNVVVKRFSVKTNEPIRLD